jgi:hypothetical protein
MLFRLLPRDHRQPFLERRLVFIGAKPAGSVNEPLVLCV